MISISLLCRLLGLVLLFCGLKTLSDKNRPRRLSSGVFWLAYSMVFLFGEELPPLASGIAAALMALIAGVGGIRSGQHSMPARDALVKSADRLGMKLYVPALALPVFTITFSFALKGAALSGIPILDKQNPVLSALGAATIVSLLIALSITKDKPTQPVKEANRLIDSFGWAIVLPQMLATLGLMFLQNGVGQAMTHALAPLLSLGSKFITVLVFCTGMMLVTTIMGNAFAAFPIMAAGVAIPVLIHQFHANPAIVAAVGMFSGYCGSLISPMNATYNIVPVALLDLADKYAVIRTQTLTALALITFNVVILYLAVL